MKQILAILAALVLVLGAAQTGRAGPADEKAAASFEVGDCRSCHEAPVKGMEGTPHMGLAQSCASCHGDVMPHLTSNLEKGEPGPIKSFKGMKAAQVNETCLTCHEKGHQAGWEGGTHERRGVSCTSCHSVHAFQSAKNQLKTVKDADTCFTCHAAIRARGLRASHHPVREGLMGCGSCHDPHDGSKTKMIKAEYVNEQCLSCHAEKRGPFLWEHAPVRESCLNCHDPHGSNHEKLLVAKQPYLCQRCHLNTRHPGTLYDARNAVGGPSQSNRAVEHACRNCHQNIHGGNAPSGPYLGR
jgi:DmsE family decaheme c-type cytochrome